MTKKQKKILILLGIGIVAYLLLRKQDEEIIEEEASITPRTGDDPMFFPEEGYDPYGEGGWSPGGTGGGGGYSGPTPIMGCTNADALNYDSSANTDDGSCTFDPVPGCTDSTANNFDETATEDDGSCDYSTIGCDGVANSGLVNDECGVCGGDNSSCAGCDGVPNSGLTVDACGVCGGDGTGCLGCDGVPNSGAVVDICGVCGGDGSSCVADCDTFNSLPLDFQATVCNQCVVDGDDSDMNCQCCTSGCTDPNAENYNPSANQDCGNEATWFDGNTF